MTHEEAERSAAVEKYLLNELPPATRDDFEAHFFECAACAADLKATSAFMEAARHELQHPALSPARRPASRRSWSVPSWLLPVVSCACLALFAVVIYQNTLVYPGAVRTAAAIDEPRILPALSLVGGDGRGGSIPVVSVARGEAFVVSLDIPAEDRFTAYDCELRSAAGTVAWRLKVGAAEAKDTLTIHVPSSGQDSGDYTMVVQGSPAAGPPAAGPPVDLARYRFRLDVRP